MEETLEEMRTASQHACLMSLGVGLLAYVGLVLVGKLLQHRRVQPVFCENYYYVKCWMVTVGAMLWAVFVFMVEATRLGSSLVTYSPGWLLVIEFVVNLTFLLRMSVLFLATYRPSLLVCLVDGSLFTQAVFSLASGAGFHGFKFLTFLRFLYPEWRLFLRTWYGRLCALLVFAALAAGAMQTAEEWETINGRHPDIHGQLQPSRGFWQYVYMMVISISTVGFGDLVPTTYAGRLLALFTCVTCMIYFVTLATEVSQWLRGLLFGMRFLPPLTSRQRLIILGDHCLHTMEHFISDFQKNKTKFDKSQVILLVDKSVLRNVKRIVMGLNIFVVPTLNLESDLQQLLPEPSRDDVLLILGNNLSVETPDLGFLLLFRAKMVVPYARVIVWAMSEEYQWAMKCVDEWTPDDCAVCMQEISADLLVQETVAPGAASILANIALPFNTKSGSLHTSQKLDILYTRGESYELVCSAGEHPELDYITAAKECYYEHGELLLGYLSDNQTKLFHRDMIPENTTLILLKSDSEELWEKFSPESVAAAEGKSQHYGINKTVTVAVKEEPSSHFLKDALSRHPYVTLVDDEQLASTVVVNPAFGPLAVREVKLVKSHLPTARVVANVPHNHHLLPDHPHSSPDGIDHAVFTSAICMAYCNKVNYNIWLKIIEGHRVASVEVVGECRYGELFSCLLQQEGLLAVGVKVSSVCVTVPPPSLILGDGDLVVAFRLLNPPPQSHSS